MQSTDKIAVVQLLLLTVLVTWLLTSWRTIEWYEREILPLKIRQHVEKSGGRMEACE